VTKQSNGSFASIIG